MATCAYCGQSAGILSQVHAACAERARSRWDLMLQAGKAAFESLALTQALESNFSRLISFSQKQAKLLKSQYKKSSSTVMQSTESSVCHEKLGKERAVSDSNARPTGSKPVALSS